MPPKAKRFNRRFSDHVDAVATSPFPNGPRRAPPPSGMATATVLSGVVVPGYGFRLSDDKDWSTAVPLPSQSPFPLQRKPPEPVPLSEIVNAHRPTILYNFPLPDDASRFGDVTRPRRQPRGPPPAATVNLPVDRRHRSSVVLPPATTAEPPRQHPARRQPLTEASSPSVDAARPSPFPVSSRTENGLSAPPPATTWPLQVTAPSPAAPPPAAPPPAASTSDGSQSIHPVTSSSRRGVSVLSAAAPPPPPAPLRSRGEPHPSLGAGGWELADFSYEALLELGSLAVPTGLDKRQLSKFKPVPYTKAGSRITANTGGAKLRASTMEMEVEECAICLDVLQEGQPSLRVACGHAFHDRCILHWLSRTNKCPMCRFEIVRKN